MTRIALVGYELFPPHQLNHAEMYGDIITELLPAFIERIEGHVPVYKGIVERMIRSGKSMIDLVEEMLSTWPDLLHYTNYRDPYHSLHGEPPFDEPYIQQVREREKHLSIMLTSGGAEAEAFANAFGLHYLRVPFTFEEYRKKLAEMCKTTE